MNRASLLAALACFGILVAGFASCSVNHPSDNLTCATQSDCPSGRTCTDGYCVQGGDPGPDAPVGSDGPIRPDGFVCPAQCTSCNPGSHTCKVDCGASPATCNVPINCPEGFNCEIICTGNMSCGTVNCTAGLSCNVDCKGNGSCKNVTCGDGPCDVKCEGSGTCKAVDCNNSCKCDVACPPVSGTPSCVTLNCPKDGFTCATVGFPGCDSTRQGCNTCN